MSSYVTSRVTFWLVYNSIESINRKQGRCLTLDFMWTYIETLAPWKDWEVIQINHINKQGEISSRLHVNTHMTSKRMPKSTTSSIESTKNIDKKDV